MAGESVAFFERRYMPLREAKISIVDPAITKSDIVFDVVSATGRVFFRLDGAAFATSRHVSSPLARSGRFRLIDDF